MDQNRITFGPASPRGRGIASPPQLALEGTEKPENYPWRVIAWPWLPFIFLGVDPWDWRRGPWVRLALEIYDIRRSKLPRMKADKLARWAEAARLRLERHDRSAGAFADARPHVKEQRAEERIRYAALAELLAGEVRWRKGGDLPFR